MPRPTGTTPNDLILLALKQAGHVGVGQTPLAEDVNDSFALLNMMLGQWNKKRWLVFHEVDVPFGTNGQESYTIGPGGDIAYPYRPDRLEGAFVRYVRTPPAAIGATPGDFVGPTDFDGGFVDALPGTVPGGLRDVNRDGNADIGPGVPQDPDASVGFDYPLDLIQSREDYSRIAFKTLGQGTPGFPRGIFYDAAYPVGRVYVWPVPSAPYEIHLLLKEELQQFASVAAAINLPNEYLEAILYNLAIRLADHFQRPALSPYTLGIARGALETIRTANAQVPLLGMPVELDTGGRYSIYTDTYR